MTTGHHRLIVGFDGSSASAAAVRWAAAEADIRGVALRVLTCSAVPVEVDFYGFGATSRAALEQLLSAARAKHPGVELAAVATYLDPRDVLIDEAASADLLVVGESGARMARGWLCGSVVQQAVRKSPCPVVIARAVPKARTGRIVAGIDSSAAGDGVVDWATDEADRRDAELVIVHAWQYPDVATDLESARARDLTRVDGRCALDRAVERSRARGRGPVRGELVEGTATDALLDASRDADIVAVGSRGRGGFRSFVSDSVAISLAEHALCPVAVVHPIRECLDVGPNCSGG